MKLFDYTKWEILEIYVHHGIQWAIQVRMNKRTGLKKFKVTRITGTFHVAAVTLDINEINALTNKQ